MDFLRSVAVAEEYRRMFERYLFSGKFEKQAHGDSIDNP